jgi:hypothetical protein
VAGRFPLFTDAHIQQPIVKGLTQRGWDIERAIDVFPERTSDDVLFEYAAKKGRVFVTSDSGILGSAKEWLAEGRACKGLVYWKQVLYYQMSVGDFIRAFEKLAEEDNPFTEPIRFITRA